MKATSPAHDVQPTKQQCCDIQVSPPIVTIFINNLSKKPVDLKIQGRFYLCQMSLVITFLYTLENSSRDHFRNFLIEDDPA